MNWLELPELNENPEGCPLRMRDEWTAYGPLACAACGAEIRSGELFLLAGYCPMGGVIPASRFAAFSDVLQPHAEHLRCRPQRLEDPTCFTVGHGTRSLEEFTRLLGAAGVEFLADIRTVPRSRHNPQFEHEALARCLPPRGVCYLHLPGLGGLRKTMPDSPNTGWRNASFRGYADYMQTSAFEGALAELVALLGYRRTAVMCAETVYWRCHRSLVADALLARGIPSIHLMADDKSVPHTLTRFARVEGSRVLYPAVPE